MDWVTSAKPRSSLCCLPHQKRTSTSTSTSTTEKKPCHCHWPTFFLKKKQNKISQGLRHIENPQNCPPCPQPYFLNEGLVRGVAAAADRRVFARIQITLPCQSRFLARNSRTALFAAQGPLTHKDLCLFISPYKNNLVAGRSPLVDHLLQMIVGDSCGCEGR